MTKTLSDKLQAEAIRISGRILFWDEAIKTAPNNMHLYKQFKEKEENRYYELTGERYQ
ncbi:MAG: hypothetical protein NT076_03070 [Candidatus Pacearchaeota archaeon]|nr:hypothetical protein [Candidatus Pacearchaeota archaeon]